jgi:glycosyltransferase involved in cell wall biosynthesis
MKIAMFTNTYLPHVGGVAKSVETLSTECRKLGHEVKIVAPEFDGSEHHDDVLRVPAIRNFNGSNFSVRLPVPALIRNFMDEFQPDVIHSHHPFLLGDAALREGWKMEVPVVFTHHTLYEEYTHYVPLNSDALKRAVIQLATEYCNLCTRVIAPSESVEALLLERGVTRPIFVQPTGIDTAFFAAGNGTAFRSQNGIAPDKEVIGHVGRLALEKNLGFLCEAVKISLAQRPAAVFLLVGSGDAEPEIQRILEEEIAAGRVFLTGNRTGAELAGAYAAMDIFAFASQSETQGLVLAEAMAAGVPVVALDGPGVREIAANEGNGVMLANDTSPEVFAGALSRMLDDREFHRQCQSCATKTAQAFDQRHCAMRMIACYEDAIADRLQNTDEERSPWDRLRAALEIEWDLLSAKMSAAAAAVTPNPPQEVSLD